MIPNLTAITFDLAVIRIGHRFRAQKLFLNGQRDYLPEQKYRNSIF